MLTCSSRSFTDKADVKEAIPFTHTATIKIALTAKDGSKAKRPHQAFLLLKEESGLEAPYPLTTKASGKATVEIVSLRPSACASSSIAKQSKC